MSTPQDRKLELEKKKARLAAIREEKRKREEDKSRLGSPGKNDGSPGASGNDDVDAILKNLLPDVELPAGAQERSKLDGSAVDSSPTHTVYKSRGRVSLAKTETIQVNFAPREQVSYNKTTQTFSETGERESMQLQWDDDEFGNPYGGEHAGVSPDEVFGLGESLPHLPHIGLIKPAEVAEAKAEEKQPLRELSEEERQQILSSDEFQKFFDRASRILERALTEEVDIFVDYGKGPDDTEKQDVGGKLSLQRSFIDEKWTKGRCVTSIDYCPQHPELIAAAYNNNEDLPHEPDGVVLVWNSKFKKTTPEYVFHCQSRVVSTTFAKFHPNLVLGGTYSGQVCLWDNRHNKKTPVQKSPLSTAAHTHPVFCIKVVGTQHAHNLISISTDGKLCSWSLDMLSQPQDSLDLQLKQGKSVAATCVSFPANDVNNFIVGSEDGLAYAASRHGTKQGVTDIFEGHFAPITGISCHSALGGTVDFSHLFLTSSFDWTVKLWSSKESKPLCSFEDHQAYVMDVSWSPMHPSVFACIDATGRLDLWNLNQDTEMPAASVMVEGGNALNKLIWMPSGQQICVGDEKGSLWLYDVGEGLANPRLDEWNRLSRTLQELRQLSAETEEMTSVSGGGVPAVSTLSASPLR